MRMYRSRTVLALSPFTSAMLMRRWRGLRLLAGNADEAAVHLEKAKAYAAEVQEKNDRELLLKDLATL